MFKRILGIITFPFYLFYMIISFPFKVMLIILNDRKQKSKTNRYNKSKGKINSSDSNELIEVGNLLFPDHKRDFKRFYTSFILDKKNFLAENEELLEDYDNFEIKELKPIEVVFIFGDSRQQVWITDWRGEENEGEIEEFVETRLQIQAVWTNVARLRDEVDKEMQSDGEFIIDVLKAIDKDLEKINKRIIFFDLDWDVYVYTVVDQRSYKTITEKFAAFFHGAEELSGTR